MLILDFFTIIAGVGVVAGDEIKRKRIIAERKATKEYAEKREAEILAENTDPELEEELKRKIKDPVWDDWVWNRLETFKRDNPFECYICKEGPVEKYGSTHPPDFGWQFVGKGRFVLDTRRGKKVFAEEIALKMLMRTYGKRTMAEARRAANYEIRSLYRQMR